MQEVPGSSPGATTPAPLRCCRSASRIERWYGLVLGSTGRRGRILQRPRRGDGAGPSRRTTRVVVRAYGRRRASSIKNPMRGRGSSSAQPPHPHAAAGRRPAAPRPCGSRGASDRGGRRTARRRKHSVMNWDQIEGQWTELRGRFAEKWGKLTEDDLTAIGGKRDRLAGLLQQRYGIARERVEKQIAGVRATPRSVALTPGARASARGRTICASRTGASVWRCTTPRTVEP